MELSNHNIFLVLSSTLKNKWKDGLIHFQQSRIKAVVNVKQQWTIVIHILDSTIKPASPLSHNLHITSQTKPSASLNCAQITKGHWERAEKIHIWISKAFFYIERTRECEKAGLRLDDWQPPSSMKPTNCIFFHNVFVSSRIKNHFHNQKLWLTRIRKRGWKEHRRFTVGFKGLA